ncbi:MAG: hypothetical protein HY554_10095 [Elusimicrobia bacterium]|nr:hypothetical protein [Elusimicrobiota bacterium]
MLDAIIRLSLSHRKVVLALAAATLAFGGWVASSLPIDVFPDLNRPTVSALTEAHGLAPEDSAQKRLAFKRQLVERRRDYQTSKARLLSILGL